MQKYKNQWKNEHQILQLNLSVVLISGHLSETPN